MNEHAAQHLSEQEEAMVMATSHHLGCLQEELHRLHRLSKAADEAAQQNIFARHLLGKAKNTRRMYQAGISVFTTFLAEHGVTLSFSLAQEPQLWQAISSGLVQAFQLWLIKNGYVLKTANDYLG